MQTTDLLGTSRSDFAQTYFIKVQNGLLPRQLGHVLLAAVCVSWIGALLATTLVLGLQPYNPSTAFLDGNIHLLGLAPWLCCSQHTMVEHFIKAILTGKTFALVL